MSTIGQFGLALTDGTTCSAAIFVETRQQRAVAGADMAPAVTPDAVGNLGYFSDHPHDFNRILTVDGSLFVGDDERGVDPLTRFRMFETSKGTRRQDTQAHTSESHLEKIASR
jgi:hypothetical protein